jgi:hypothetical protein
MLLTGDRSYFTNPTQIITSKKFIADKYNPFYSQSWFGSTVYKDWSTECVNLSAYMGQEVSVLFIVGDCSYTAHGAYAFIDCLCENNNAIASMTLNDIEYCQNDEIILDGTASVNEDSYFLAVAETDKFGNVIPGTEKSQWYVAQQAGVINFTSILNQWNYNLKCNTYYKVKLAVANGCTNWNETSKIIFIRCPENVLMTNDIAMCCNNLTAVAIGDLNFNPGYNYNWTSTPYWNFMANNPTYPSYSYTPFVSTTFNVTVTDTYGCTLEDEINILLEQDFDVEITVENLGCCSYNLVPSVNFNNECGLLLEEDPKWLQIKLNSLNYVWSDGYTGKEHQVSPAQNTTYYLTISNACFTKTVSVYVPSNLTGNFPTIIAPNAMMPSSIIPANRKLTIREFGSNSPSDGLPAYNAKEYLLEIYDRWGHRIRTITGGGCNVLQAEIQWDGNSDLGKPLPTGVYVWKLYFKNCTHSNWQPVCHSYSNTNTQGWCAKYCIKWNPFPKNVCCKQWNDPCAYRITLLR